MPHPIYGPPDHVLERVELKLYLPTSRNSRITRLEASGWSETKRGPLWSIQESWSWSECVSGLQPCDALHHVALVAAQDRPVTQGGVEFALTGETEPELPFE